MPVLFPTKVFTTVKKFVGVWARIIAIIIECSAVFDGFDKPMSVDIVCLRWDLVDIESYYCLGTARSQRLWTQLP